MASSSGNSVTSGSSESDLQHIMDQRKRKRMLSNRDSARRSRMRKQKQLDDLMAQVNQLRAENNQILNSMNITTQLCLGIEAENSILEAQMAELTHRLNSLNEIINCVNSVNSLSDWNESTQMGVWDASSTSFMINNSNNSTWGSAFVNNNTSQPVMGLAEMPMY